MPDPISAVLAKYAGGSAADPRSSVLAKYAGTTAASAEDTAGVADAHARAEQNLVEMGRANATMRPISAEEGADIALAGDAERATNPLAYADAQLQRVPFVRKLYGIPRGLAVGAEQGIQSAGRAFAYGGAVAGVPGAQELAAEQGQRLESSTRAAEIRDAGDFGGRVTRGLGRVGTELFLGSPVARLGAGALPAFPAAGALAGAAAPAMGLAAAQADETARRAGLSDDERRAYVARAALIEGGTTALVPGGAERLFSGLAGGTVVREAGKEIGEELLANAASKANDFGSLPQYNGVPWQVAGQEFLEEAPETIAVAGLAGGAGPAMRNLAMNRAAARQADTRGLSQAAALFDPAHAQVQAGPYAPPVDPSFADLDQAMAAEAAANQAENQDIEGSLVEQQERETAEADEGAMLEQAAREDAEVVRQRVEAQNSDPLAAEEADALAVAALPEPGPEPEAGPALGPLGMENQARALFAQNAPQPSTPEEAAQLAQRQQQGQERRRLGLQRKLDAARPSDLDLLREQEQGEPDVSPPAAVPPPSPVPPSPVEPVAPTEPAAVAPPAAQVPAVGDAGPAAAPVADGPAPVARPLDALSPAAQAYVQTLSPEDQAALAPTIQQRAAMDDRAGDKGNLEQEIIFRRAKEARAAKKAATVPATAGMSFTDAGAMRARADAAGRGELATPKPSPTDTTRVIRKTPADEDTRVTPPLPVDRKKAAAVNESIHQATVQVSGMVKDGETSSVALTRVALGWLRDADFGHENGRPTPAGTRMAIDIVKRARASVAKRAEADARAASPTPPADQDADTRVMPALPDTTPQEATNAQETQAPPEAAPAAGVLTEDAAPVAAPSTAPGTADAASDSPRIERDSAEPLREAPASKDDEGSSPTERVLHAGIPSGPIEPVLKLGEVVGKAGADWWSKPLIDRVARTGGAAGQAVRARAQATIDTANRLTGEIAEQRKAALQLASGWKASSRRAVRSLREIAWDSNGMGENRMSAVVNGTAEARVAEKPIVDAYQGLMYATGRQAEKAGVKIAQADGSTVPFTADKDRQRLMRSPSEDLFNILAHSDSDQFKALAKGVAEGNDIPEADVIAPLKAMGDRGITKLAALEVARTLPWFPTHMRFDGRIVPLLNADPFPAIDSLTRNVPARVAFITHHGQGNLQADLDAYVAAGGKQAHFEDLMRALNHMPLEVSPGVIVPGTAAERAYQWGRTVVQLVKTGQLTNSFIPNTIESIAKTPALGGVGRWFRAFAEMAKDPKGLSTELARMGARTVEVMNWMTEQGKAPQTVSRIARSVALFPAHVVNEFNELHAATVGKVMAADLKAGHGTKFDRVRLQVMGFNPAQVDSLIAGKADPALYESVATRMAEVTQGSTSRPAQQSRAAHSLLYQHLTFADRFTRMTFDRTMRVNRALVDGLNSKDGAQARAAAAVAAQYYFGATASGVGSVLLRALIVGGPVGLGIALSRLKDEPDEFLAESAAYSLLGGPTEALRAMAVGDKDPLRAAEGILYPVSLLHDLSDLLGAKGRYRDQSAGERAATFLRSKVAISGPVATAIATYGLGKDTASTDAAIRAFYKWRAENAPVPRVEAAPPASEEHAEFRIHLRRAVKAMEAKEDPLPHIEKAVGLGKGIDKDEKNIAQSLRGRKLLADFEIRRDDSAAKRAEKDRLYNALRSSIGAEALDLIATHDEILEEWAARVSPKTASAELRDLRRASRNGAPEADAKLDAFYDAKGDQLGEERLKAREKRAASRAGTPP